MTNWLDTLDDAWDELAQTEAVARQYRTKLISTAVPIDILAAIRAADNAPCLMLETQVAPDALFELGGMRLSSVPSDQDSFIVLSLEDSDRRDLFATICADVITAAVQAGRSDALTQFLARLDAWRQFLRDRRDGLSRAETIGLVGELMVLEQVLTADSSRLASWLSPSDGLHDFQIDGHALEVKTSLGPSSTITISALDQLDTSGLRQLDLLRVRLIEASDGRSVRDIIAVISNVLPDDLSRRSFENALLRRGLMPDDQVARATPKVQLGSIDAYSVTDGFPRLARTAVPLAITEATYSLEVRAITAFTTNLAAVIGAFVQGDDP